MHVFMTGASGWIGSAAAPEILALGHTVSSLARSEESAEKLRAAGVIPVRGGLDDLEVLRENAIAADAVVHLANKHDWVTPGVSDRAERAAVETFVTALEGTDKPFLLASGTAIPLGRTITEDDPNPASGPDAPRGGTESLALEYADRGVRSVALRFAPTTHGRGDHGFSAILARAARESRRAVYPGDGQNHWSAVHRLDAGRLVALALTAPAGTRVHAVAEVVTTRAIAEAFAAALGVPAESVDPDAITESLGFVGRIFGMDLPASSDLTRERFGWEPTHPTLLEDIAAGAYS